MKSYRERPPKTARKARQIWDILSKAGIIIIELWFNPNCWYKVPSVVGNAWGWWGVNYYKGFQDKMRQTKMFIPGDINNPEELIKWLLS